MSELFTRSTALKFENAVTKPPRQLSPSYSGLSTFLELVSQQWSKSALPILSTSHCEFYGTRSCAHARKTIPLAPIHPFTKQIVPLMYEESLT